MCRPPGYLGAPNRLQALVEGPPHGLLRRSRAGGTAGARDATPGRRSLAVGRLGIPGEPLP